MCIIRIMSIAAMLLTIHQNRMLYSAAAFTTTTRTAAIVTTKAAPCNNSQRRALRILLSPKSHININSSSDSSSDNSRNGGGTHRIRSNSSSSIISRNIQQLKFIQQHLLIPKPLYAVESRELRFYNSSPPIPSIPSNKGTKDMTTDDTLFSPTTTATSSSSNMNIAVETQTSTSQQQNQQQQQQNQQSHLNNENASSFDLPHQVSYFTSLFQRSNSNFINLSRQQQSQPQHYYPTSAQSAPGTASNVSVTVRASSTSSLNNNGSNNNNPNLKNNYNGPNIYLTPEEQELFDLLSQVIKSTNISSTLRVAGGWVRDKLLATDEFQRYGRISKINGDDKNDSINGLFFGSGASGSTTSSSSSSSSKSGLLERLTSKYQPSIGRQGTKLIGLPTASSSSPMTLVDPKDLPVDIDIALDDMLGREFADHLNEWLTQHGQKTISVGVVLKNPEKSKHLETATMKVGKFWIDFVNLRAEEYTEDSRIPDLMRIGTAQEDAFRRDLTINALFYNINTGQVEDYTGRGFDDLKRGVIATPLPALTTLLDDPLRVLRSVRFAARLRFTMEESLRKAAKDERVRVALAQKVARERIGAEVDLMLRSQDPVGAMRLLINLNLALTVFSIQDFVHSEDEDRELANLVFTRGLYLLSTTHDHLVDCKVNVPIWCEKKRVTAAANHGVNEVVLMEDDELRRKLWYASFLKPLRDRSQKMRPTDKKKIGRRQGKKANRSVIMKIMVDELKRPVRDAETVEAIMKGADDFTNLLNAGCDSSSKACLLTDIMIIKSGFGPNQSGVTCMMGGKIMDSETEEDPLWLGAMEYRLLLAKVVKRLGHLWRAAMILSLSEQLAAIEGEDINYTIEGDVFEEAQEEKRIGVIQTYDIFAASLLQMGLVGIWSQQPLIDGKEMKSKDILPNIPMGPVFREIMNAQEDWMIIHPGGGKEGLVEHLREVFHEYI